MKIGKLALVIMTGIIAAGGLSGCAGAKRAFGMQKVAPDEFTVVTKAPLVLPPDYSLRPPQPGAPNPGNAGELGNAEYALFGREGQLSDNAQGYTSGEVSLLDTTGGSGASPDIRKVLNAETASLVEKDNWIAENILFWQGQKENEDEAVINAKAEAERIKSGGAADKPATESTASAEKPENPEKKGWFDRLF